MLETKQFKLSNGNEIICEVISWPDEDVSEIVARNVIQIMTIENPRYHMQDEDATQRCYIFRPWMMYNDGENDIQLINPDHVLSTAKPSPEMLNEYTVSVFEMSRASEERRNMYFDAAQERENELMNEIFGNVLNSREGKQKTNDSSESNLIQFPIGPSTVH